MLGDLRQALGLFERTVLARITLVCPNKTLDIPVGRAVGVAVGIAPIALTTGCVTIGTVSLRLGATFGISVLVAEIIRRSRLIAVVGLAALAVR